MRLRLPAVRILSVVLFALLCGICAYWGLKLLAPRAPIAPAGSVAPAQAPVDLTQAGRLFGGAPEPVADLAPVQVNIQVSGVVAAGRRGVALLSVEGKPAKAYQVGQQVADGIKLAAVAADSVQIDRLGQKLTLPAPPRGSIAVLTSGPNRAAASPAPGAPTAGATAGAAPMRPPPLGAPGQPPTPPLVPGQPQAAVVPQSSGNVPGAGAPEPAGRP